MQLRISKTRKEVDTRIHLGSNFHVSVKRPFARVDVRRRFLPDDANEIVPTRRGISITFQQWSNTIFSDELDKVTFCEDSNDHQNPLGWLRCPNCNPNDFTAY
ncbi:hypothetical protein KUTeg_024122 [Tegillarca granosa]|uniref:Uncharacterized protein n=1 Tax=Tegillarca granosa TaxID=220873 RepID=A0ABQ9DWE8_TEGGR|nr:hypothetical protein KUTeg_024122 [Tegillarca granosa]